MEESSEPAARPRPPTDFSEFHQQEMMRRLREEQENETEWDRRMKALDRLEEEKKKAAEEARKKMLEEALSEYWEDVSDSDEEPERQQLDDGTDVEDVKKICRDHIAQRLEILRSGVEEGMEQTDYDLLAKYDRMRIEYLEEHAWDMEQTERDVHQFIAKRIEESPFQDVVVGYKVLQEIYDPILGPDFYYLSLFDGAPELGEHERWALFGY